MIELKGMVEEEIGLLLEWLARRNVHVAFEGAQVVSEGGIGHIAVPLHFGPSYQGRRIATVGAPYRIPKVDLGNHCCPHFVTGEIESGDTDIVYDGVPIVMVGDTGKHWPGCGTAKVFVAEGWRKMASAHDTWDFTTLSGGGGGGFTIRAGDDPDDLDLPGAPKAPVPVPGIFGVAAGADPEEAMRSFAALAEMAKGSDDE
ncbi:hypothetical protein [Vannielia sp. SX4]|uniref:hypothetical protein n=1 Tax=Vannielia sp. SX4 TaxID=3463852 RepID=UPI004059A86E